MKVAVLSDLHGEFHNSLPDIKQEVEVIVLAGDIVVGWSYAKSQKLIKDFCDKHAHSKILWVFGNHEYYGCPEMDILVPVWKDWADEFAPNLAILDNESFCIGDVVFHGSTLWTGFNAKGEAFKSICMVEAERNISDFYKIGLDGDEYMTAKHMEHLHVESVKFLHEALDGNRDKTNVVITHFPPLLECRHPHIPSSLLDGYFNNDLIDLVYEYDIKAWVSGHNHWSDDFELCGTRFVSNQLGYPREHTNFEPVVIIEV